MMDKDNTPSLETRLNNEGQLTVIEEGNPAGWITARMQDTEMVKQ